LPHGQAPYWDWFASHWNADKAVQVVEQAIGTRGRPRWIAYRMILPQQYDAAAG